MYYKQVVARFDMYEDAKLNYLYLNINHLKKLKYIYIWGLVSHKQLPFSLKGLILVEKISIFASDIETLPKGLLTLPNLRELEMNETSLKKLPRWILKLKKLKKLTIDYKINKANKEILNILRKRECKIIILKDINEENLMMMTSYCLTERVFDKDIKYNIY